jgi:hypothetical protein
MMQPIDARAQMVVDLSDCSEIKGADAADLETNQVHVREITYSGEVHRTIHLPSGIKIVRRR